jgi:hypothetical protein
VVDCTGFVNRMVKRTGGSNPSIGSQIQLVMERLPSENHEEKFLKKLQSRFKNYVDLTPYLVRVAIVTIIIFLCSIFIWYSFMRPDPNKGVIKNVIEQFEKKK